MPSWRLRRASRGAAMRQRALLIGCRTGALRGVDADVALMADTLTPLGFEVTRVTGPRATRRGIIDAYRALIDATGAGDAAVVYYSGHGGQARDPGSAPAPGQPARIQYLCPTDIDEPGPHGTFRGLFADELSVLQDELSARTANVTTVIDSCHSARMARTARQVPKARTEGRDWATVHAAWRTAVRTAPPRSGRTAESNPSVVRLVACEPDASAYEVQLPGFDGPRGLLTASLARLLRAPGASRLTWRTLLGLLRPAVLDVVPFQRPEVEGPADRLLFDTREQRATGVLPVAADRDGARLDGAELFGIAVGDQYALVPPGGDPERPLALAVVDRTEAGTARLRVEGEAAPGPHQIPPGTEAHPLHVSLGRRPVLLRPADHPDHARVAARLGACAHLRIARSDEPALAALTLTPDGLRLDDADGEPLRATATPATDAALDSLTQDLRQLARAAHVRALASGTGPAALPDDVSFHYALLCADGTHLPLDRSGAHVFHGDEIVVRIHNRAAERRHVSVFDIGLRGAVTQLTTAEPAGVGLDPGAHYELFRLPGSHRLAGIELYWPDGLPRGAPRPETLIAVVTDRPQDLTRLAQRGIARRGPAGSALQRLVDDVLTGVRDARVPEAAEPPVRYRVTRCDVLLHHGRRSGPPDHAPHAGR
ncbi:caspase family protein [Streptomyces spectabilis]|uniref:Caspase family protein n=2 Tax=Streptomyces spectabilis TaxID=68270 RepID=A0A516RJ10_STRST|nr:caspase family protein [Streptomyces spectabilis]